MCSVLQISQPFCSQDSEWIENGDNDVTENI